MKLYHISQNNLNNKVLNPRIPDNFFTKNGYEDNVIKRVCFSTSINGCLIGLGRNIKNEEFYIHEPIDYSKLEIKKITTKDVPDCKITKEVWVLNNVKLKCVGKIKVNYATDDYYEFTYGNHKEKLYDWNYNWIMRNNIEEEGSNMLNKNQHSASENCMINESNDNMIIQKPKYEKKYKCPYCDYRNSKLKLIDHVEDRHEDMIPEGYSPARVVFNSINKKAHGTCIMCKKETKWNDKTWKYERICSKKCHDDYVKMVKSRMKNKYGKEHLLDDPKYQEKMLSNRKISGEYKFKDGGIRTYCGSYEQKLLEFFDKVLNVHSKDILSPGPIIEYTYKGKTHNWITDQYYVTANLVFDVKDGGSNPNNRKMEDYRAKQIAKERAIEKQGKYNYIRLTDNDFAQLLLILAEIKEQMVDPDSNKNNKIIRINENAIGGAIPALDSERFTSNKTETSFDYIVPCELNGQVSKLLYSKDKYLSNLYKLDKDNTVTKADIKELDGYNYTLLKYIGKNKVNIKEGNILDSNFYTEITSRDYLSNDQIFLDEDFIEVLDNFTESNIKCSIIENTFKHFKENGNICLNLIGLDEIKANKKLQGFKHINIKEDIEGYYAENEITLNRTEYYKDIESISEDVLYVLSNI